MFIRAVAQADSFPRRRSRLLGKPHKLVTTVISILICLWTYAAAAYFISWSAFLSPEHGAGLVQIGALDKRLAKAQVPTAS